MTCGRTNTLRDSHVEMGFYFDGFREPLTASKKNAIWVIVDRLTKSAHFVEIHDSWNVDRLAQIYVKEVMRLHGVPPRHCLR